MPGLFFEYKERCRFCERFVFAQELALELSNLLGLGGRSLTVCAGRWPHQCHGSFSDLFAPFVELRLEHAFPTKKHTQLGARHSGRFQDERHLLFR